MVLEMPRLRPRYPGAGGNANNALPAAARTDEEEGVRRVRDDDAVGDGTLDDVNDGDDDDGDDETTCGDLCCAPLTAWSRPVEVGGVGAYGYAGEAAFWVWPLFGPLLFENTSSDVRDGLANERTFLSYLRLSVTMAVVAVAIVLSFHLKSTPTQVELRMARPLGILFWLLAVLTLVVGVANYIKTVNKYSRRAAIVQTGWKTQSIMASVAFAIFGSCVALLVINKIGENKKTTSVG
ncbi:hypothetical protein SPI_02758 [Niveomyces insectorum RCEF 264]|uniref:DUF202 domain-containing protein n=1 Tax=Niveomyces insectorum RCEF 264 TaxID=1081102 RepID=A0A167Y8G1_9HYPO|nr:hypothetical protein SPI_02758 [Niveomyces insectorum RCEF 264]